MFRCLVDFGGRYIYPNTMEETEYNKICMDQINETIRSFKIKMCMMTFSLSGAMCGPLYGYLRYGTKTTMTNVKIPFTEQHSTGEFLSNFVLTTVIGIHGFIGYIGLEVAMALFSDTVTISPKITALDLKRLDEKLMKGCLTEYQFCHLFSNIIKRTLDTDEYGSPNSRINSKFIQAKTKSYYILFHIVAI